MKHVTWFIEDISGRFIFQRLMKMQWRGQPLSNLIATSKTCPSGLQQRCQTSAYSKIKLFNENLNQVLMTGKGIILKLS